MVEAQAAAMGPRGERSRATRPRLLGASERPPISGHVVEAQERHWTWGNRRSMMAERAYASQLAGRQVPQLALRFALTVFARTEDARGAASPSLACESVATQSTSYAAEAATPPGRYHGAAGWNGRDVPNPGHVRRADPGRFDEPIRRIWRGASISGARQESPLRRRNATERGHRWICMPTMPWIATPLAGGSTVPQIARRTCGIGRTRRFWICLGGRWNRSGRATRDG